MKLIKNCSLLKPVMSKQDDNVITVAKKLHECQERRLFVLDKNNRPVGIISIVDINDRVVAKGRDLKKTKAKDIMTHPLNLVVDINETVDDVARKMVERNTFYCPVTSKGVIKGLINYSGLMKNGKK